MVHVLGTLLPDNQLAKVRNIGCIFLKNSETYYDHVSLP